MCQLGGEVYHVRMKVSEVAVPLRVVYNSARDGYGLDQSLDLSCCGIFSD